ncbi:MAG: hypothetical protein H0T79_01980 [Deltaproteobacteria bacterium]|nr:hypothetical protein [Deltaproteobacteria bacterium]
MHARSPGEALRGRVALVIPSILVALAGSAHADDATTAAADAAAAAADDRLEPGDLFASEAEARTRRLRRHLVYAELRGKGGQYGIGYEYALLRPLSLGIAGSFEDADNTRRTTLAPYLHLTALRRGDNALFGELGAVVVREDSLMDRMTTTTHAFDALGSVGWERTHERLVFRVTGSVLAGDSGTAVIGGLSLGFRR